MQRIETPPREGQPLPLFTLPSTSGVSVRLWSYKQRQPTLLIALFSPEQVEATIAALTSRQPRLRELDVAVLLMLRQPIESLSRFALPEGLHSAILSDTSGDVVSRYLPAVSCAALYATDRYLQCIARSYTDNPIDLSPLDPLLAAISAAEESSCGCSIPAWPTSDLEIDGERSHSDE